MTIGLPIGTTRRRSRSFTCSRTQPWDTAAPVVPIWASAPSGPWIATSASLALGYQPVGTYEQTVQATLTWLGSLTRRGDTYAYPPGFDLAFFAHSFDYESEDRYVREHA